MFINIFWAYLLITLMMVALTGETCQLSMCKYNTCDIRIVFPHSSHLKYTNHTIASQASPSHTIRVRLPTSSNLKILQQQSITYNPSTAIAKKPKISYNMRKPGLCDQSTINLIHTYLYIPSQSWRWAIDKSYHCTINVKLIS